MFSPDGELTEFIPIPEDTVTNCAFGGPDLKTLYVTAGKDAVQNQNRRDRHPSLGRLLRIAPRALTNSLPTLSLGPPPLTMGPDFGAQFDSLWSGSAAPASARLPTAPHPETVARRARGVSSGVSLRS